jgi:hypothetical protein
MPESGRRTVVIRGQVVDRYSPRRSVATAGSDRRASVASRSGSRPASARSRRTRPYDLPRSRPDRVALWAVLLGIVLLLAAATSSHAAVLHAAATLH